MLYHLASVENIQYHGHLVSESIIDDFCSCINNDYDVDDFNNASSCCDNAHNKLLSIVSGTLGFRFISKYKINCESNKFTF